MSDRIFLLLVSACLATGGAQATAQSGGPTAGPLLTQELHDEIAAKDLQLFAAIFDTCHIATLATLVADDFDFYHDKDGLSSTSGTQFVKAIEVGEHRFYQLLPGQPEKLVEISLSTQVWRKDESGWRLTRVLSYGHRLTA